MEKPEKFHWAEVAGMLKSSLTKLNSKFFTTTFFFWVNKPRKQVTCPFQEFGGKNCMTFVFVTPLAIILPVSNRKRTTRDW